MEIYFNDVSHPGFLKKILDRTQVLTAVIDEHANPCHLCSITKFGMTYKKYSTNLSFFKGF
jgi:hypothetical protein